MSRPAFMRVDDSPGGQGVPAKLQWIVTSNKPANTSAIHPSFDRRQQRSSACLGRFPSFLSSQGSANSRCLGQSVRISQHGQLSQRLAQATGTEIPMLPRSYPRRTLHLPASMLPFLSESSSPGLQIIDPASSTNRPTPFQFSANEELIGLQHGKAFSFIFDHIDLLRNIGYFQPSQS